MSTQFYNSLTKKKETFKPIDAGKVKLYTCGPTVYDMAHIGNFRAFMFEDLLKRYLLLKGFEINHIMNITDVDDKTIKRSFDENIPITELTKKYTDRFFEDLKVLKILPANIYPKATDHIPAMVRMIENLVKNNNAYITDDGSVYFAIDSYHDYGQLINLDFSQQKRTNRISSDEYTKDKPQDFVLWKSWKEEDGDVFWESPWGKGRPGWHIECSAMSTEYLGNHFDIHCGGVDNLFPHHENEIAQTVCATGEPFVNIWMHCEYLLVERGKMSKSQGNIFRISDLVEKDFSGETLRYILLNTHYRSKLNFTMDKKHEAVQVVQRITDLYDRLLSINKTVENDGSLPEEYSQFEGALDNDLDTPGALAVFFEWVRKTNIKLGSGSLQEKEAVIGLNFLDKVNSIFDLIQEKIEIPMEILDLVNVRQKARQKNDWVLSDKLRDKIYDLGWTVEDTLTGQKCKPLKS